MASRVDQWRDYNFHKTQAAPVTRNSYSTGCVEGFSNPHAYALPPPQSTSSRPPVVPTYQLFEVNVETNPGDTVIMVGSIPALGIWDVHKGLRLSTDSQSYPVWHLWISGCLPACEYKFAVLKAHGADIEWEQMTNNRTLVPSANRVAAIFGVGREVARTRAGDAALFAMRQEIPPHHHHHASPRPVGSQLVTSSTAFQPKPHPISPRALPPPLALGSSFVPVAPPQPGGASNDSTPNSSRPISRTTSHNGSFRSRASSSTSLRRNGSRVSFSQNLVDVGVAAPPMPQPLH